MTFRRIVLEFTPPCDPLRRLLQLTISRKVNLIPRSCKHHCLSEAEYKPKTNLADLSFKRYCWAQFQVINHRRNILCHKVYQRVDRQSSMISQSRAENGD